MVDSPSELPPVREKSECHKDTPRTPAEAAKLRSMRLMAGCGAAGILVGMLAANLFLTGHAEDYVSAEEANAEATLPAPVNMSSWGEGLSAGIEPVKVELLPEISPASESLQTPEPPESQVSPEKIGRLEDTVMGLEERVTDQYQQLADLALSVESFLQSRPWEKNENKAHDKALQNSVEAHQSALSGMESRIHALEQRVPPPPPQPPFTFMSLDMWNDLPYLMVELKGKPMRLRAGDSLSGWLLEKIDAVSRKAHFSDAKGRTAVLTGGQP